MRKKKLEAPWLKSYGKKRKKSLKYPNLSMYDLLEKRAREFSQNYAYEYFGNKVTYDTFISQIDQCARSFKALKIGKGDVVTICSANTPEAIVSIYALNKIGAIANIVHPLSSQNEIKHCLNLTQSKLLVIIDLAFKECKEMIPETSVLRTIILSVKDSMPFFYKVGYEVTSGKDVEKPSQEDDVLYWPDFIQIGVKIKGDINAHTKADDCAAILYSGGTTGKPKGIVLTNNNFNAVAYQCNNNIVDELHENSRMLGILPIFHGFGLGVGFHCVFNAGACTIILPKFDGKKFDKTLSKYKPTIIIGVPTVFEAMVKNKKIKKMDLSFLELVISGGDALSATLNKEINALLEKNGAATVIQGYGLTECLAVTCVNPPENNRDGSIGLPLPDIFIKIIEPNTFEELKTNEVGEMVITGPNLMVGYLHEEEETNEVLKMHDDGHVWLHTGDLGYIDEDGYIYFKQRLKRMIVSSGYNVYPSQIEEVIEQVEGVLTSTVVGVPHKYRGQVAKAYVVLKEGVKAKDDLKKKIMDHCKKNLAKYSLPVAIEFRKSLPKTKIGKVDYKNLK